MNTKILYLTNFSFWKNAEQYSKNIVGPVILYWIKAVLKYDKDDFDLFDVKTDKFLFSATHPIEVQKKEFAKDSLNYQKIIYVFNSLYDINPSRKKALRYIYKLQSIGYIVYILSINPTEDCSKYLKDLADYNGVYNLENTRERSEKYSDDLLRFAADLRLASPPVKYHVITKYTQIPKGTLISYMRRNKIFPNDFQTGRDTLTEEELLNAQIYTESGNLNIYRE